MTANLDPKKLADIPDPFAMHEGDDASIPDAPALPDAPARAKTRSRRLMALAAAVACEAAMLGFVGLRNRAALTYAVVAYGVLVPLTGTAVTIHWLQRFTSRASRVPFLILGVAAAFWATTFLARAAGDESAVGMVGCLAGASMMAAGPAIVATLAMRHAYAAGATWRSASLGLASGLVGIAAIRLSCPNDAFAHVLIGHGGSIVLATLVSALLGPRVTRA